MKYDLIMHFRRTPINGSKHKFTLGKTGKGVDSQSGVTIVGVLDNTTIESDHKDTKLPVIMWGAAMCHGDNFEKHTGVSNANKFLGEHVFYTEDMSYNEAKDFARKLAYHIWKIHSVPKGMEFVFNGYHTDRIFGK